MLFVNYPAMKSKNGKMKLAKRLVLQNLFAKNVSGLVLQRICSASRKK